MQLSSTQLQRGQQASEADFLSRLEPLLLPHSPALAALPPEQRRDMLAKVTTYAQSCGLLEELNIGLFALLLLLVGAPALRQAEPQAILQDTQRSSSAKVYQLWAWYRQIQPNAPVFAAEAGRAP
jgi:hypothetical protein